MRDFLNKHESFIKGFKQGLLICCIILPSTPIMKTIRVVLILLS